MYSASSLIALQVRNAFGLRGSSPVPLGDGTEFALDAPIANIHFHWPRTLLAYPVEARVQAEPGAYRLLSVESHTSIPFQISRSNSHNELLFLSDLPANSSRRFRLVRESGTAPAKPEEALRISREAGRITIDLGPMQVRIPDTQRIRGQAPGPILAVARDAAWTGESKLQLDGAPIVSLTTEELEAGPLRSSHRMTYATASGATYIATVECIAGMDFVRLVEDMEGLPHGMTGDFDFAWTGCNFAYRKSPNHPYNFPKKIAASYADYPWEPIAPAYMDTQFGVSSGIDPTGKLPFELRVYEPQYDVAAASFANFWGDGPSSAAIFIDRSDLLEDHQYALWRSSSVLEVQFIYRKPTLHFVWKLARGSRSTCLSYYDHARDIEVMHKVEQAATVTPDPTTTALIPLFGSSHALESQNWYGTLSLDKVKDWQLTYSDADPKPLFQRSRFANAAAYYRFVAGAPFVSDLALTGVRHSDNFGPVSGRQILESWVPGYQIFQSQLTPAQRRNIEGILLLMAYVHAGEDFMPLERMLAGHPNFLSDVKSTPPGMAFLFPKHPQADTWADEWEAYLRMNTRYHTRPTVETWSAQGGRWTENLGTYVWAFLRPALRANYLLQQRDGYQRFCTPHVVMLGDWLVNALSAPFAGETPAVMKETEKQPTHYWGIVSPADGPRRVHPPMGAHSERRKPPRKMWYMATTLRNYSPLTAEHMMWASCPTDQDMEQPLKDVDPYLSMFNGPDNRGTNPHLRTSKYTGFGITLRAAVDTPSELSIHLLQIDDGPNYRWGNSAEGSCGVLYFFANGKGYSYNGFEDAGDRVDQDTDFTTNFGVWKDGAYRAIGQNMLVRPLYDLHFAQFAELLPREGDASYSWPEYVSRSILLAGEDYFLIHDQVFNPEINHRFSWYVRKGDDFPYLTLLNAAKSHSGYTTHETEDTSGRWYDGVGDSLVLATHKENIHARDAAFGARVTTPSSSDLIFSSPSPLQFQEGENAFAGTAGLIRISSDVTEMTLIHGTHIATAALSFTTADPDLGISARIPNNAAPWGYFFAPKAAELQIALPRAIPKLSLYIDGERAASADNLRQFTFKLPAGRHRWELTPTLPVPLAPSILRTESQSAGAVIHVAAVASATSYSAEISSDNATTWVPRGSYAQPIFTLDGLDNGSKYHVRITAHNSAQQSSPGPEYPIYVTGQPLPPPDGLFVALAQGSATLTWGETLGATGYRVYRRSHNEKVFRVVTTGLERTWIDPDPAIVSPSPTPADSVPGTYVACEYYVTALSHNGESKPSRHADTNPASWRNWNPTGNEPFRRVLEQRTPNMLPNDGGGKYYPR